MSNANHQYQGQWPFVLSSAASTLAAVSFCVDPRTATGTRPYSNQLQDRDTVEALVNACLDTSGIDRRYNALIMEELRDCTNLTHDQLRQAAFELTRQLRSSSPPYVSVTSPAYDSPAAHLPSSDERLYESSVRYPKV